MSSGIQAVSYKKGSYITVEGEPSAHSFYIIQEGSVLLSQSVSIPNHGSKRLGVGDFFEVESALTGRRKLFTAVAATDSTIIVVPKTMYDELIQKKPSLVQKIILSFSQRMRSLDGVLAKISINQTGEDSSLTISHLLAIANYYNAKGQVQPAAFAYHNFIKNVSSGPDMELAKEKLQTIQSANSGKDLYLDEDTSQPLRRVPAGTMIFAEAMPGDCMYFIQEGSVKICKLTGNLEIALAVLKKGELFGEMALLENKPRSATVIAEKDCTLLVINDQNFPEIIKRQPALITKITTVLARRIWFVYRQITNVMLPPGQERLYDGIMLFLDQNGLTIDGKNEINLPITKKDLFHHTGLSPQAGEQAFNTLLSANVVRVNKDGYIQITNPVFVQNRAIHFREVYKQQAQKKTSSSS